MEQELQVKLNSLEKRLKEVETPGPLMYRRPGSEEHENLVDFLNDTYIQLQEVRAVVEMTERDSKVHLVHKLCQH
ncbi:hypothetical protein Syn1_088 [Prochlorococcus phage Syn1]|uniref:Uncharacterized protein n=1 Tax=Prochlorococcus phage Syn1 TaxID=444861 RepID=E3SPH3_9CAUD|nr:hypothetical protein Syn1_088 [Prochlorococcus phage Syn1]ADO99189.1 hypothetical protein Syn1_088 [Prochlorococcus phage Syn1]